jgi:hypothetical protein
VSVYFAKFPAEYLRSLRDVDINRLQHRTEKIKLHHTRLYNLCNTMDRTEFIKEFVALIRFVAAGEANIGYLGKNCSGIHRTDSQVDQDERLRPPQEEMNGNEEEMWRKTNIGDYTG